MTNKFLIYQALILGLLANIAHADDRTGRFDEVQLMSNDQSTKVQVKAPATFADWILTLPANDGAANQCLATDGAGITSWAGPFALPGDALAIGLTKIATAIGGTTNSVAVSYLPTGAAGSMVNLRLDSRMGTDFSLAELIGLTVDTSATQNANTNAVVGVESNIAIGRDDVPTTTADVKLYRGSVSLQDQATVSGSLGLLQMAAGADAGASLSYFEGVGVGGNFAGTLAGGNVFNFFQNIETTTGYLSIFKAGGTLANINGVSAIDISTQVGGQATSGFWNSLNEGPSAMVFNGYTGWNHHPSAATVRQDYNVLDAGGTVTTVGRNVNGINLHNTMTEVNAYYNGFRDSTDFGSIVGGAPTVFSSNIKGSVPGAATMFSATPQISQRPAENQIVEATATADVAGSLGGKYVRICTAYSENPNACFKIWLDVDNSSSAPTANGDTLLEVDIAEDDTATAIAAAMATVIDGQAKLDASSSGAALTIVVVANGSAGGIDTGNIGWAWTFIQGGGGDGTLTGYSFGAAQSSGYNDDKIIAFDAGGHSSNFGKISAYKLGPIIQSPDGNPVVTHVISSDLTAGDNLTVSDADAMGVGSISTFTVGNNTTLTSGPLGVGAVSNGKITLVNIGAGSTVNNVGGDLMALVQVGGSGVLENGHGARAMAVNFGASAPITNYRAFFADSTAAGIPATSSWGFYAGPNYIHNYVGSGLKIGGAADGTNDKIQSASVGLEIADKHIRVTGVAPSPVVDGNAGVGATCVVSQATDTAGVIQLTTTSDTTSSGPQCTVTFATSFVTAPICTFSAYNAGAASPVTGPYLSTTPSTMVMNFAVGELVGVGYVWAYHCIETN